MSKLPDVPCLATGLCEAVLLSSDGEIENFAIEEASKRATMDCPIVCHRKAVASRLNCSVFRCYDILELFAFVRPAEFCIPTIRGVAKSLGIDEPFNLEEEAETLIIITKRLLMELKELPPKDIPIVKKIAAGMAAGNWIWGEIVLDALDVSEEISPSDLGNLRIWEKLPEWSETAPDFFNGNLPVKENEALERLAALLKNGKKKTEERPQQADYASAVVSAFNPHEKENTPWVVLAEAGTGIGKTLGYIASASVWAEKNQDTVWISTYTRNLQRQIDDELELLFPDKNKKEHRIVIRKGRENYLCLLNLEEAVGRIYTNPENAVALGLICRWALKTRNGDIAGGDFPGWLSEILGRNRILGLADRRGECVFSSCSHYKKCFIERTVRRAKNADIVVANHALVMMQAALGGLDDTVFPTRYVFDEGHHLFHAADSAFSAHLTCRETSDLRRWLIGAESSRYRTRAKGLKKRAEDIIFDNLNAIEVLNEAVYAARILPTDDWVQHVDEDSALRISEKFFALVQQQVYARTGNSSSYYSLETETSCPLEGLLKISQNFENALEDLISPLKKFVLLLKKMLDEEASELETTERQRIESLCRSIKQRAIMPLEAWQKMLQSLADKTPESFVDWFEIERKNGHNVDIGMYRHWIDPMLPFAETFAETAHGIAITSATLRDRSGDDEADWKAAEQRSGINHIYDNVSEASSYNRATIPSPFDYPAMTRVLIVNDVRKDSPEQVSAAYRELFLAANGGGLGIFTAISRLKDTYSRIAEPLDKSGLQLLAQHVDAMDTSTLIDIFRAEENSCLLGTDAVRDGVDVPGNSLRLIVFDRTPWTRPSILHKVRRKKLEQKNYDDMLARMKLCQAFGRLIRSNNDRGVFVLLDSLPSRLLGAFPENVEVMRVGLKEAIKITDNFLEPVKK